MKTLKIGVLTLAILAVFGFVLNTNAQTNTKVSVTINAGTNACTLESFNFTATWVSATEVDLWTIQKPFTCTLYKSTANQITIQQQNLSWLIVGNFIPKTSVTVQSSWFTNVGTLTYVTPFAAHSTWSSTQNLYTIMNNQVGTTTSNITVGLKIPGGTPADVYSGSLVITVPSN